VTDNNAIQKASALTPDTVIDEEAFDMIVQAGDISRLTQPQRTQYVYQFTKKLGLNPLTKPIDLIPLNGRLTLYANRTATDQPAQIHKVSVEVLDREMDEKGEVYSVRVKVKGQDGREDENIGAVGVSNLTGEALANAKMKAYTKAKRRAILSFCGLGFLDELEIESIQGRSEEMKAYTNAKAASSSPIVTIAAPDNPAPDVPEPGKPVAPAKPPTTIK